MDPKSIKTKLLAKYREVASERVSKLENLFSELQKSPANEDASKELMRELHTLKGESRMMGFKDAGKLVHTIEEVLKNYRTDPGFKPLDEFSDLFYESIDTVSAIAHDTYKLDVDSLCKRITSHLEGREVLSIPYPPLAKPKQAIEVLEPSSFEERVLKDKSLAEKQSLSSTIRVSGEKLDKLSDMIGDLFTSYLRVNDLKTSLNELTANVRTIAYNISQISSHAQGELPQVLLLAKQFQELQQKMATFRLSYNERTSDMVGMLDQLVDQIREFRLQPISGLFSLYRTTARNIARASDKQIKVQVEGETTLVDRSILEALNVIMLHLVNNAIAHGITRRQERLNVGKPEYGMLTFRAGMVNDRIQIEVEDDGCGIDPSLMRQVALQKGLISKREAATMDTEASLELIFQPGFSTSSATTEVSGRGIGMDVVRTKIQDLGGAVIVDSTVGKKTCFSLEMPTSIAIVRMLLFRAAEQTFAILSTFIRRVQQIESTQLINSLTGQAYNIDEQTVPVVQASEILGLGPAIESNSKQPMIVLEHSGKIIALAVDELVGERELTVKPFSHFLTGVRIANGTTSLEDGTLILVLQANELIRIGTRAHRKIVARVGVEKERQHRVLLVEDSLITRELERSVLTSFGLLVEEAGNGVEAMEKLSKGQEKFDIIVSDVEMPNMNGLELTRQLKSDSQWANLPIVLVTTLDSDEDKQRGLEAGADAYILKSEFGSQTFMEVVQRFL